jgi:tetratricopeptide (TPR) repeat protein
MSSKKIVKTTSQVTNNSRTFLLIKGSPSKANLTPLAALCKGLKNVKNSPKIFLINKEISNWEKLISSNTAIKESFDNGTITLAASADMPMENEADFIFFLPLKYNRTALSYQKIIQQIVGSVKSEETIYALGKNTSKQKPILNSLFGFIANAWSRIIHGINASNIAAEIVGFSMAKYTELSSKYGKNADPLLLVKQGIEQGDHLNAIDADFGEPAYGLGAGFIAIIRAKWIVAKGLPQRFVKVPLQEIKSDGISLKDRNSPFYKLSYFFASILIFLIMMFSATDFNVTWDEPGHLQYSEHVLSYYTSLGDDTLLFDNSVKKDYLANYVLYGASVDTIAEAIHSVTKFNIYSIRRYLNGIIGFLTLLIIALLAKHFFGWRAALLALLAGFLSPSFFGHFFNNHKDIPFALGYVMTAYFLILLLSEMPKAKFQTAFMLALGVGFSLSIRASGLAQFAFVLFFLGIHWLIFSKDKAKQFLYYFKIFIGVSLIAYLIGISLWPYALRDPIGGPISAFKEFSNFSALHYMELFEGVRLKDKPWYYEPQLILITAPLMILAGWALFALTAFIKPDKKRTLGLAVLLIMTFAPSAYAIYKESYLYNGWRHFLFIYPTLVVLAIWGWEKLMELLQKVKIAQLITPILAIALLVPAALFNLKNHPYQYMYFNELIGGVKGAEGEYELDYWSQTSKEAFEWAIENIPEAKTKSIRLATNNIEPTLRGQVKGGDSFIHIWTRELEWYNKQADYSIFTTRTLSKNQILQGNWPPKGTIHEIKVDGVTVAAVVKNLNKYGGDAYYAMQANKPYEALALLKKAYAANPKEEEYARGIGVAYKAMQNWDSAILFLKVAAELRDHNYEAQYNLGECYLNKATAINPNQPDPKLIAKAKENFQKAANNKSNYSSAFYYLGTLALAEKLDYDAINQFTQALTVNPNFSYAYTGLGKAYSNIGKIDSAIINFSISAQINQQQQINNPEPYYYLAQLYQKKGDQQTAQQYMQQYQQMVGGAPTE